MEISKISVSDLEVTKEILNLSVSTQAKLLALNAEMITTNGSIQFSCKKLELHKNMGMLPAIDVASRNDFNYFEIDDEDDEDDEDDRLMYDASSGRKGIFVPWTNGLVDSCILELESMGVKVVFGD